MRNKSEPLRHQFEEYERQKRKLIEENPYITPEEYSKSIAKIAKRLGV